nr:DUF903 domain-containing protein [Yersinia similis]
MVTCLSNDVVHTDVIHISDGCTIVADGKPKVDDETEMISHPGMNGV